MKLEKSPIDWTRVVAELSKGRDLAAQLEAAVSQGKSPKNPSAGARELIKEVMGTLTRAIDALEFSAVKPELDGDVEDKEFLSGGRKKMRKVQSGQREGYRRRSRGSYSSSTMVKAKTLDDGHSWRKYGQKAIYNAKFPRNYFRCTHKYDQGCAATRQVQRSEDDPSSLVISYFGHHTCRDPAEVLAFISKEEEEEEGSSCIIDFTSNTNIGNKVLGEREKPKLSPFMKRRERDEEEVVSSNQVMNQGSSMTCDFEFPELETLEFIGGGIDELADISSDLDSWDSMMIAMFRS